MIKSSGNPDQKNSKGKVTYFFIICGAEKKSFVSFSFFLSPQRKSLKNAYGNRSIIQGKGKKENP